MISAPPRFNQPREPLIKRVNFWSKSQCILPVLLLIGISRRSKLIFTGQGLSKACFPHRHARESVHTVINLNARSSGGAPSPPFPSPRSSPIRIAPGVDWNRFTNYRVESSHVNVIFLCTRERLISRWFVRRILVSSREKILEKR